MLPSTKKKLDQVIQLLWEVSKELTDRKLFFSILCRSLAEALTRGMEERWCRFVFDLPNRSSTIIRSILPDTSTCHFNGSGILEISSDL